MSFSTSASFIIATLFPLPLLHDSTSFKTSTYEEYNGKVIHELQECDLSPGTTLHFTFKTQSGVTIIGHDQNSLIIDKKTVYINKFLKRNLDSISFSLINGSQGQCTITPVDKTTNYYLQYIIFVPRSTRIICQTENYIEIADIQNSIYVEGKSTIVLKNLVGPEITVVNLSAYNSRVFLEKILGTIKLYSNDTLFRSTLKTTRPRVEMHPLSEAPGLPAL